MRPLFHVTRQMYLPSIAKVGIQLEGYNRVELGHEGGDAPHIRQVERSYGLMGR